MSSVRHSGHDDWSLRPGNLLADYTAQIRLVPFEHAPPYAYASMPDTFRVECRCGWGAEPEEQADADSASRLLEVGIRRGREHLLADHAGFDTDVVPSSPLLVHCHGCQRGIVIDTADLGDLHPARPAE